MRARIQNDPDLASLNILVQEKPGIQLKGLCNFVDIKIPDFCGRTDCFPCITTNKPTRGRCWKEGVNYCIECLACQKNNQVKAIYHGESGFSAYFRGRQHMDGFTREVTGNTLYDHNVAFHPHEKLKIKDFRMTVVSSVKRPILRLSKEGVLINHTQQQVERGERVILMNDRAAFHQPGVRRIRSESVF